MSTHSLKLKLLKEKTKDHVCERCGLKEWLNAKIPLELHHINGNPKNNCIENLQVLCPNCHALTDNYRGRNKKKIKNGKCLSDDDIERAIVDSFNKRQALLSLGLTGYGASYDRINRVIEERNLIFKEHPRRDRSLKQVETINNKYGSFKEMFNNKIIWPNKEDLEDMLKNLSAVQIGKNLGVSDNAVRKAAKRYGIDIKTISKWSKKHGS